ncbi:hypothetical protein FSARC_5031 [Fusarium sarcochroum]|uniref:Zn(2)-C6 fungal-type domain-containing protein n=1 Tax=Fusarium sarcochroum TaxID=1208366 RepID=A0A8H4U0S0_9HYPO|nr:hypothetical protein FSARC_5031 [Fusarium sarcochroum]
MQPQLPPSTSTTNNENGPRNHLRSRAGCWTCREKKVKCDETRPQCRRCIRLNRPCDYEPRPRKAYTRRQQARSQTQTQSYSHSQYSAGSNPASASSPRSDLNLAGTPSSAFGCHSTTPSAPHTQSHQTGLLLNILPSTASTSQNSLVTPSPSVSEACLAILEPADYHSIHCFRFDLAPLIYLKDPELSAIELMWKLAQNSEMVLHMIVALGAQQLCYQHQEHGSHASDHHARKVRAAEHYGSSLRLLALATAQDIGESELDLVLATLWLMIEYEQRFGDGSGSGLSAHLKGAASIIQGRLHNLRDILKSRGVRVCHEEPSPSPQAMLLKGQEEWPISAFAARIVVWISYKDGAAALNGFGGFFNELLGQAMEGIAEDEATSLVRGFEALHRHSNRASSDKWALECPQEKVIEDIHSRPLFYLFGNTGQFRFLLSKLAVMRQDDSSAFESSCQRMARLLNATTDQYAELIDVAHTLRLDSCGAHRSFVINVRDNVSHYHAIVMCYSGIVQERALPDNGQRAVLGRLMNIAFQTHSDEGESAMSRVAWPLFVAALESDDAVHRKWIMDRYQHLSEQGENYRRAHAALKVAFSMQHYHEKRVDLFDLLWHNEQVSRFLI